MGFSKLFSLKTFEQRRKWTLWGMGCASIGLYIVNFAPETVFLYKLKNIFNLYRLASPAPLPEDKKKLFETVLEELKIPAFDRPLIEPFYVTGLEVFHAGSIYTKWGALVGIPINFTYKNTLDVHRDKIQILNQKVDWSKEISNQLLESLVLSEKAQKFAIGHEIFMVCTPFLWFKSFYPSFILFVVYSFGYHFNNRLMLSKKPAVFRGTMYVILSLLGITLWAFFKDMLNIRYEIEADQKLFKMGKDYIEGGIEYYTKVLQRNLALRELMGEAGESSYSEEGDVLYFMRTKSLPFTYRKQSVEEEFQKSNEANNSEPKNET